MIIEVKTKGQVEYEGRSKAGHVLTIEKIGGGYVLRSYQVKANEVTKKPLNWEDAYGLFRTLSK
jgi:hypothetical protein